jgi:hypothetical protein
MTRNPLHFNMPTLKKALPNYSLRVHVIKRGTHWAVLKEGAKRASRLTKSKQTAISHASKVAGAGVVVVHKADGSIERWDKAGV